MLIWMPPKGCMFRISWHAKNVLNIWSEMSHLVRKFANYKAKSSSWEARPLLIWVWIFCLVKKENYRLVALEYWLLIKILGSKGEASAKKETYIRRSNLICIVYQMLLWWSNQGSLCGQYVLEGRGMWDRHSNFGPNLQGKAPLGDCGFRSASETESADDSTWETE